MSGTRRLIRNARLIDPESGLDAPGDLLIDGDKIAAIGPGLAAANGALGFTDGVKAVADALVMRRVLSYARSFDQLVIQHPEEPSLGGAGEVTEGEIATRLGLPAVTPMAEIIMIERDLRLVEITGARFHIAHVSTAGGIDAIHRAKAAGLPVTCDTAPPYF